MMDVPLTMMGDVHRDLQMKEVVLDELNSASNTIV